MNFSLAVDTPFNTVLVSPDGHPVYRVDTPYYFTTSTTTVKKIQRGGEMDPEIGRIEWQSAHAAIVRIGLRDVVVHRSKLFGSSRTFIAVNGQSYKWKFREGSSWLSSNDSKKAPAATFTPLSGHNPALLHVTPHGMTILEDVIVTFLYVEGERRNSEKKGTS
ncbi:hypothetical protein SERLA73DRAFT_186196 [Serpula lacrymans var. lacrymans S7.3]|uniref:DUF6593 domain-containing protein n=2 Tax=Serpula lacrymans var. lacrymans TaxID=341189 RepID=F8Q5I8_SERL3|nr:uncharacterized protein SERLADRAFT_475113 [Serpula lacrymans var. lacrymans S7.9]EGN96459.1 hypothetical protein SERLA73DRAFT_186196 [Serpula lacrymans var. lacrymans S7.3]EGO22008.1 hypothetical protein SERLADRAFT_475113 [Serpula lacrymans var. lacrymans S7.9]